jgi:hypothetical protein
VVAPPALRAALAAFLLAACAHRATVRPEGDGRVVFAWDGAAEAAWVCGTMTSWSRVPLQRVDGGLQVTLAVPPGRHEYRLEVLEKTGIRVVVPPGAEVVADGFGGENAVLRVEGR